MHKKKFLVFGILSLVSQACFHDEELRKEFFNVNTRVVALEQELQDKQQMNSRQQVSASSRVSQMQDELQKIRGEIDRLQVGIQKGEIPGLNENEPTIAKQLATTSEKLIADLQKLEERMTALEKTQNEVLSILEKMDKKKGAKPQNKQTQLSNLKSMTQAFEKKRFQEIVSDAPQLLSQKGLRKSDYSQIRYFYSESLYKVGKIKEAAISFGELSKKEGRGDLGPKIHLRLGDCFRNLGDKKTALAYYRQVVEKFPKASESESARKNIKKLEENPS